MAQVIRLLNAKQAGFAARLRALRAAACATPAQSRAAQNILRRVERDGAAALFALTAKHDGWRPKSAASLRATQKQIDAAWRQTPPQLRADLQYTARRLRAHHRLQLPRGYKHKDANGNICGEVVRPVARAVVYAPGGKAAYPSSVLMGVVPAKVAGVREVLVTTPAPAGKPAPLVLAAAKAAGASAVYLLGGAQAVGAFALGCGVPRADVVVGPGNVYVAEAKRQIYGRAGADSIAGPSEVLIVFDETAPPAWVAADLLAQAEHDEMAQCIAVSPSAQALRAVAAELRQQLAATPRRAIAAAALRKRGALALARSMAQCVAIANEVAPEHAQVMTRRADAVAKGIVNAGGVFVGAQSCVAFGDYAAGTNHVLPTGGAARFSSPLGVENFIKRGGYFKAAASAAGVCKLAQTTARLASAEGLPAHAASALLRLKKISLAGGAMWR